MNGHEDPTVVQIPDATVSIAGSATAKRGIAEAINHMLLGEEAGALAEHRRLIRKVAEDDAIARMFQQRALAVMLILLAGIVPGAIALLTWGLYTGDIFR